MKKLIIFAAQECVNGIKEVSILNSLFCVESIARDSNAVAKIAQEQGYETYVYMLHHVVHEKNKRYLGNYLDGCQIVKHEELASVLKECDKAVFLGIPAMAGSMDSFSDRNYGNMWYDYSLNGESMGQMGMLKVLLAEYEIPVIAVMSDTAGVDEAKRLFKNVRTVTTAYDAYICAGAWQCCSCYPPEQVREQLQNAVKDGLNETWEVYEKYTFPLTAEIDYIRTDYCDVACAMNKHVRRLSARKITWQIDKIKTLDDMITRGEE